MMKNRLLDILEELEQATEQLLGLDKQPLQLAIAVDGEISVGALFSVLPENNWV